MKKLKTLFLLLFISNVAWLQSPCGPNNSPSDSPPGCVLCQDILNSSTANFTAENFPFNSPCGKVENSQWLSVRSNSEGDFSALITVVGCFSGSGIDVILYTQQLVPISDCVSVFNHRDGKQLEVSGLTPGVRYLLLVDGNDAAVCDFSIQNLTMAGMDSLSGGEAIEIIPNTPNICVNEIYRFSIPTVENADFYSWDLPFNAEIASGGNSQNSFIDLQFSQWTSGVRAIKVAPEFTCFSGSTSSITVNVITLGRNARRTLFVCPEELPKMIDGIWVEDFGFYDDTIRNEFTSCPEIVRLSVNELELKNAILDTVICPGACIVLNDSCYFEDTDETIVLPCLYINFLNIIHADTGYFDINCFVDPVVNSIVFDWKNLGADSNDIFINDVYHTTQSGSSFLLDPNIISGDSVKFRVVPRSALGCPFKSSETICATPKTSDIYENDFEKKVRIFPSPTSDFIEIQAIEQIDKLEIIDISGQSQPIIVGKTIDISHLNSGVYFLKMKIGASFLVRKIIIL